MIGTVRKLNMRRTVLAAFSLIVLCVPAHAAVHESVELVKRARKRSAAPLVNAVLRKAAKEADSIVAARPSTPYLGGKK